MTDPHTSVREVPGNPEKETIALTPSEQECLEKLGPNNGKFFLSILAHTKALYPLRNLYANTSR